MNAMKWRAGAAVLAAVAFAAAGCGTPKIHSYDVEKYVSLCDYEGMEVDVPGDFTVTDDDAIDYIDTLLAMYPGYEDTDKKTVEDGDCVNIDYVGKKDGVAFDGGSAEDYVLEIGSGTFIDGFEEGLIGVDVGETVDLNLTFPEDYQSEELAGAAVVFTVTVNKIVVPEELTYDGLTDEYVSKNMGYDTVDDFLDASRSYLEQSTEQNREVETRKAVIDQLIANSKVAIPDGLLDMKADQYRQQFIAQNCSDGTSLADYLSENYAMTEEEFLSEITNELNENLDDELALEAFVKAENLKLDEDGYGQFAESAMESGGYATKEELYEAYDSEYEDGESFLRRRYLLTDALTKLVEKCEINYTGAGGSGE